MVRLVEVPRIVDLVRGGRGALLSTRKSNQTVTLCYSLFILILQKFFLEIPVINIFGSEVEQSFFTILLYLVLKFEYVRFLKYFHFI